MKKSLLVIAAAIGLVVIASVAIWKTSGDDSRRQGALVDEPVTLNWHGDWNAATEYTAGSVVTYEGASYVAEGEKLSTPMPDCAECGWTTLALEGSSTEAPTGGATEPAPATAGTGFSTLGWGDDRYNLPSTPSTTVGTLRLPAGKYLLFAKLLAWNQDRTTAVRTTCELRAGALVDPLDLGAAWLVPFDGRQAGQYPAAVISLMASAVFASSTDVTVVCRGSPENIANVSFRKINALAIDALNPP